MPLDIIRPIVQSDARVEVWYRTNVILYARPGEGLKILANLKREHLANLDLPYHLEIVGLKRAATQFWTARRRYCQNRHRVSSGAGGPLKK